MSLPVHEVHLIESCPWTILLNHEKHFDVNQNLLAEALKNKFSPSFVFFFLPIDTFLSTSNKQEISCLHKSNYTCICFFYHICFIQRWWVNFQSRANLIGLLEFHIALSETLLTACAYQLLYKWNLIKLCSAYAKQNAAV